jgi:hypothetical protein
LSNFQDIVEEICRQATWSKPEPIAGDEMRFDLEGGLSFTIKSLTNNLALLKLPLANLSASEAETDRFCRRLGQMAAASFRKRRTILSFNGGVFYLHMIVDVAETNVHEIPSICGDFLNDCQWWLKNAAEQPAQTAGLDGLRDFGGSF